MVYIYEVQLKKSDRMDRGIRRIFGVDSKTLQKIFYGIKKAPRSRVYDCDGETVEKVTNFLRTSGKFGSFLKLEIKENIQRLRKINSSRGIRLYHGKPVHGQRTHTNAKTSRRQAPFRHQEKLKNSKQPPLKQQRNKKPVKKQQNPKKKK